MGLAVAAVAVGCGDDDSSSDEASKSETKSSTAATEKPTPKPYRERVADCVGDVGFSTRDAGNALRVESPGGSLIANIQTFKSASEAQAFNSGLEVDGAYGGKGVAVWLADADDAQKRVVADCLTP